MAKSVFITGAYGGIGEAMARAFARRGYAVGVTGRNREKLVALATALGSAGASGVAAEVLDVTDLPSVPAVMAKVADKLGGLDIVIANSGIAGTAPIGRGGLDYARKVIETNLVGAMATVDAAIELFRKQGKGHVVGVTSVAAVRGLATQGPYAASKAGLSRYLEAARMELAGSGIRVTELAPGFIDTELNRHMPSRPFVVSAEKGGEAMVALIERGVDFAYVPQMPWTAVAQLLKVLPSRFLTITR